MAGVRRPSGAAEIFIFRYQYLLVEVGTQLLRQLFDVKVGHDFAAYLASHSKEAKLIPYLIKGKSINKDQAKYLPPIQIKPKSSDFDISLLTCLLRNVCGMAPASSTVWMKQLPTDTSEEADISRLRVFRNELMHRDTVMIPETNFDNMWKELTTILLRLNNVAGIASLQSVINNAEHLALDEKLEEELNKAVKDWAASDSLFEQKMNEVKNNVAKVQSNVAKVQDDVAKVQSGVAKVQNNVAKVQGDVAKVQGDVAGVKSDVVGVQNEVSTVKQDLVGAKRKLDQVAQTHKKFKPVELADIQKDLIEVYKRRCNTLPVSPLFDNKDENILEIYKRQTMCSLERTKENKQINCFKDIFCKESKPYSQVYITGDAGMGKTSFCTFMCKLWCVRKLGEKLDYKHKEILKDAEYMSKFDLVFYISLRNTEHFDVINMIREQYLRHHDPLMIQDILRKQRCLILMDGLDEWQPKQDGKRKYKLPEKFYSDKCVYITTCRPYKIESVRLSRQDVDHHVKTTGIHGDASQSYVTQVIQYMNEENCSNKKVVDFIMDVYRCGFHDQLCIPMVVSHLVVLWFEKSLTDMPRALIYANILEMLFRRAKKREVEFPPSTASTLQLPDSLCGLEYLNEYVSLLYNVSHLSFRSLFKQDEYVTNLVFTRQQLLSPPYCFSIEETDFLCKIGILSKHEVFGCYSEEKLKVSFIHKSYVEFFASLFMSSFDRDDVYSDATQRWKTIDDVLQFENFFLLLAGFSYNKVKSSIENIYCRVSDDLAECRRNSILHYDNILRFSSGRHVEQLQDIVIHCYKEISRSNVQNIVLKLEDFSCLYAHDVDIFGQLLLLNTTCVKSVYSRKLQYFDAFDKLKNLQYLHVDEMMPGDDVKFTKCMLNNQSTLHTICIDCRPKMSYVATYTLVLELPVRRLHQMTSLSLSSVTMQHEHLHDLVSFLSDYVHLENVKLSHMCCHQHRRDCKRVLNLQNHAKLSSVYLYASNILCKKVNTCSLKSITLHPMSTSIFRGYIDILNSIKCSQLEHLHMDGTNYFALGGGTISYMLNYTRMRALTDAVKSLHSIKSLKLSLLHFPDDIGLELHPDTITQVEIKLCEIVMSCRSFHCFIDNCLNKQSVIKVELDRCRFTSVDGGSHRELSVVESMNYMSEYLTSIPAINITSISNDGLFQSLHFETTCL